MSTPDSFASPDGSTYSAPGTAGQAALKLAFENWFGGEGYDDQGRFDMDEMEFAFEAGAEAQRDLAAAAPAPAAPAVAAIHSADDYKKHLDQLFAPVYGEVERLRAGLASTEQEPQAAPGLGTAWRLLNELRDGIRELEASITASADATRPSRKTQLEDEFAIALGKLLEDAGEGTEGQ